MDVKPGYKVVEVGVIPEEWDVKPLDEVALVTSGKRLPIGYVLTATPTQHPYIRVTDMRPGSVDTSALMYVPENIAPLIRRYRIFCDDLFISVAGTLGIVGKIPTALHGANLTENADRITAISCDQDYLLHVMQSDLVQSTIADIRTVGAQPKLALTRIRQFAIPLPPLPEQRAIATALTDVDDLLTSLDRLIAKKRAIKQGVMHDLLTGRKRLPGFSGEWEVRRLGDTGKWTGGVTPSMSNHQYWSAGDFPWISSGDVKTRYLDDSSQHITQHAVGDNAAVIIPKHSIVVVVRSGILRRFLPVALAQRPMAINQDIKALSLSNTYWPEFVLQALMYYGPIILQQCMKIGTTVESVDLIWLKNFSLSFPLNHEQMAIASVLTDMDDEIDALQARRDKTHAIKQAMMHELLTGRTRLV